MIDHKRYQWDSKDYAANSEVQQQWAVELMNKLSLQGDEQLLDIGCGDGKITVMLARNLPRGHVTGIDSSAEMIQLAHTAHGHLDNIDFRLEDARVLPFTKEFDVIFSNAALHWIRDHRPVLESIFRSLRPGGRVLVQMGGKGNAADVVRAMEEVIARHEWQSFFENFTFPYGFYGPGKYSTRLKKAGFEIRTIQLVPKDMVHENRKKFTGWLRTTWLPYLQRIPGQLQTRFVEEVVSTYLGTMHQGKVHTAMMRLEYLAVRPG